MLRDNSAPYEADRAHWSGLIRASKPGTSRQTFWVVLRGQSYLQGQRVVLTLTCDEAASLSHAEIDAKALALANRRVPA